MRFSCFLQNLFKEQERLGREVEEEVELRMRNAEREEKSYTELLHNTEANMQVRAKKKKTNRALRKEPML